MTDAAEAVTSERSRVLTHAVAEAAKRLGIKSTELKQIVGTSQPTASRLLNGKYALPENSKSWELAVLLVRLYRSLSSMVGGDDELARRWLTSANRAFGGQVPAEFIKRVEGLIHACEYLDAHRARI